MTDRFKKLILNAIGWIKRKVKFEKNLRLFSNLTHKEEKKQLKIATEYINNTPHPKLQIGCGGNVIEGWLNTDLKTRHKCPDICFMDMSKPFPFQNETFRFIFMEHCFGALDFLGNAHVLTECFRALQPDGVVRISVPSLEFLINLYQNSTTPLHQKYIEWNQKSWNKEIVELFEEEDYPAEMYVLGNFYRDFGLRIIYDYKGLSALLKKIGFVDIKKEQIGTSNYKELRNLEKHGNVISDEFNELETMVVEARKPNISQ